MAESIAQLRNRRIKAIKLQYLRYEDKIHDPKIGFRIPILDPGFFKIFKSSLARKFLDPGSWILMDPEKKSTKGCLEDWGGHHCTEHGYLR